uniref:Myb/SANT-like DNA-binding domain-containing protein n=1 Tax=Kalanchoe fedtschenkoi TaxID=63787 RepID=A0A7N0ZRF3_KALFE
MEDYDDDDDTPTPDPNDGRITVSLAADAVSADHLAHNAKPSSGGGAREDCWSEAATSVLIDAWGERYLALSRGNLKQKHWKEVADIVSSSGEMCGKTPKTDMQCKNRIDTVKKKYKLEKSKMVASASPPCSWPFFHKLEFLIGPAKSPAPTRTHSNLHNTFKKQQQQPARQDSDSSETDSPDSPDSTDTDPPKPAKKQRFNHPISTATSQPNGKMNINPRGGSSSVGDLTEAILNLAQVYEQAENAKLRLVVDMEKNRMNFTKELESQRMQLFMKTQMEITQMKESAMRDSGHNHLHSQLHKSETNLISNNIDNHTSDST